MGQQRFNWFTQASLARFFSKLQNNSAKQRCIGYYRRVRTKTTVKTGESISWILEGVSTVGIGIWHSFEPDFKPRFCHSGQIIPVFHDVFSIILHLISAIWTVFYECSGTRQLANARANTHILSVLCARFSLSFDRFFTYIIPVIRDKLNSFFTMFCQAFLSI